MGLDMYLTAEKYVSGWKHSFDPMFTELAELTGLQPDDGSPHFEVKVCVGYWRKANAIHAWFVEHVQNGVDNCQEFYVSREKLEELRDLCRRVLETVETVEGDVSAGTTYHPDGRVEEHTLRGQIVAQKQIAESLLPTQSGFFFGGTDYDCYYLEDVRYTADLLDSLLSNEKLGKDWTFNYRSSW